MAVSKVKGVLCRALLAPVVRGAENVPDGAVKERGCLFVGNHTQFGMYDLPFLMYELYLRGHKVRRQQAQNSTPHPCYCRKIAMQHSSDGSRMWIMTYWLICTHACTQFDSLRQCCLVFGDQKIECPGIVKVLVRWCGYEKRSQTMAAAADNDMLIMALPTEW